MSSSKGPTAIGKQNRIYQFSSIGEDPQDKKYANEVTRLEIGDRNTIREFSSLHRGTKQDQSVTKIGNDNLFMAYTHVAHDCVIGNHVIMANGASLAGHVQLHSHAILGGFTLVHQFTKIGQFSFAAMGSAITQDIPPFVMVGGKPTRPHGINSVGMERNGIAAEDIRLIRKAYKMIYKMNLRLEDAIDQMEDLAGDSKELSAMVNFSAKCQSRHIALKPLNHWALYKPVNNQKAMSICHMAGIDEAGRGPLAGPVVAAAVILDPNNPIEGLADSKKLSETQRDHLAVLIRQHALAYSIAQASVAEIDRLNILQATLLAMQRAVQGLSLQPDQVLVDGNRLPKLAIPAQAIVKGDSTVKAISAASILAKVTRDAIMVEYQKHYPDFAFHVHKGYGTRQHILEIEKFGCLDIHRRTFNPVKTLLSETKLGCY